MSGRIVWVLFGLLSFVFNSMISFLLRSSYGLIRMLELLLCIQVQFRV